MRKLSLNILCFSLLTGGALAAPLAYGEECVGVACGRTYLVQQEQLKRLREQAKGVVPLLEGGDIAVLEGTKQDLVKQAIEQKIANESANYSHFEAHAKETDKARNNVENSIKKLKKAEAALEAHPKFRDYYYGSDAGVLPEELVKDKKFKQLLVAKLVANEQYLTSRDKLEKLENKLRISFAEKNALRGIGGSPNHAIEILSWHHPDQVIAKIAPGEEGAQHLVEAGKHTAAQMAIIKKALARLGIVGGVGVAATAAMANGSPEMIDGRSFSRKVVPVLPNIPEKVEATEMSILAD